MILQFGALQSPGVCNRRSSDPVRTMFPALHVLGWLRIGHFSASGLRPVISAQITLSTQLYLAETTSNTSRHHPTTVATTTTAGTTTTAAAAPAKSAKPATPAPPSTTTARSIEDAGDDADDYVADNAGDGADADADEAGETQVRPTATPRRRSH